MNFIKLIQKFKDNRKNITIFFMFFVVFYLFSDVTFAASTDFGELKNKTAEFAEFLLKGISLLLALITYLATIFLSPTWINGSLFGLNVYFKEIWILVSNVVYFIFAFILIWIAFMNIIGKTGEMYQLKQAIPNFIVGVLIVPFSWFLVQFILSISAVLTVAGLSLPFDTFDEYEISLKGVTVPVDCTLNLQGFKANEEKGKSSNADDGFIYCDEKGEKKAITEIAKEGDAISSIFGVIAMYTYGVLSLDTMDEVAKIDTSLIKTMGDLIVKIVFDLLFVVIYSILMITLGLVLMIRGIYIWIYMMMSPVFGLMYFFGKSKGGDGFFAKFNLKEFIALAMVPVYTMLALSFGLLFLYVIGSGIAGSNKTSSIDEVSVQDDKIQVGQFNLKIIGAVSKEKNATNFLVNVGNGGLGIVGSLILKVFGIVVLWGTIMAAMRTSEITKEITEPIYKFGTQVGGIMTSLPGNIPIFPTGKGGMQSMQSLNTAGSSIQQSISTMNNERAKRFSDQLPFVNNDKVTESSNNLKPRIDNPNNDPTTKAGLAKDILKAANGDVKNLYNNSSLRDNLFNLAKSVLGEDLKNKLNIDKSVDIKSVQKISEIYEAMEAKGGAYNHLIDGNGPAALEKAVKDYKDGTTNANNNTTNNSNEPGATVTENNGITNYNFGINGSISLNKNTGELNGADDFKNMARMINRNGFDRSKDIFKENLRNYVINTFGFDETIPGDKTAVDKLTDDIYDKYEEQNGKYEFK